MSKTILSVDDSASVLQIVKLTLAGVFGMPKEAIVLAAAAKALPLERLTGEIVPAGR